MDRLLSYKQAINDPYIILGDFNDGCRIDEKLGGTDSLTKRNGSLDH